MGYLAIPFSDEDGVGFSCVSRSRNSHRSESSGGPADDDGAWIASCSLGTEIWARHRTRGASASSGCTCASRYGHILDRKTAVLPPCPSIASRLKHLSEKKYSMRHAHADPFFLTLRRGTERRKCKLGRSVRRPKRKWEIQRIMRNRSRAIGRTGLSHRRQAVVSFIVLVCIDMRCMIFIRRDLYGFYVTCMYYIHTCQASVLQKCPRWSLRDKLYRATTKDFAKCYNNKTLQ